jgi:hypothetical protein
MEGRIEMKRLVTLWYVVVLAAGAAVSARPAATGTGAQAFEKIKSLAGHWEELKPTDAKATMDIQVTSAGSVVQERFNMVQGGKPVEMITMYYLDGDQLKMTHYCEAGNQPTMLGTYAPATKTLTFDFLAATNMKSPNDGHMHHAVYTFLDNDHFKTVWTFQKDQKDAFTEDVTYVRK